MDSSIHRRVKSLLEETNAAYDLFTTAHMNADYAEFAALSLREFKEALANQHLTDRQLMAILRRGHSRHRTSAPKSCWATFMASYVSSEVNNNAGETQEA